MRQVEVDGGLISIAVTERIDGQITERTEAAIIDSNKPAHLLICLHGIGCSKKSFDGLFAVPELQDVSIVAFDFPGHGDSGQSEVIGPTNFEHSMENYAEVAFALLQQVARERAVTRVSIVAHSMGGAVGLLLAERVLAERLLAEPASDLEVQLNTYVETYVNAFINIEGNLVSQDCGLISRRSAEQPLAQFVERGFDALLRTLSASKRNDLQAWLPWLQKTDPRAFYQAATSLVEWSDSGNLLELFNALDSNSGTNSTRTTYIHGNEDDKEFVIPRLRNASIVSIPRSGHFPMVDNPDDFLAAVVTALS